MSCPQNEKIILAVYDELGKAEQNEFDKHVAECESCRAELARVKETDSFFACIPCEAAPEIAPNAFPAKKAAFFSLRFRWTNVAAAIAIGVLLTVLFVNNFKKPETTKRPSMPSLPPVAEAQEAKPIDSFMSLATEAGKDLLVNAAGDFVAQGNENDIDIFGIYGPDGYSLYEEADEENAEDESLDIYSTLSDLDFNLPSYSDDNSSEEE